MTKPITRHLLEVLMFQMCLLDGVLDITNGESGIIDFTGICF